MGWKEVPISKPETDGWDIAISASDLEKLKEGYTAQDMDDRWAINFTAPEGNPSRGAISCIRSWTGFVIMRGEFRLLDDKEASASKVAVIDRFLLETDIERYASDGRDHKKQFIDFLNGLLDTKLVDSS